MTALPANTIPAETVYPPGIASAENRLLLKKAAVESKDDAEGCRFVHWKNWKITRSGVGALGFSQIFPHNSKRYRDINNQNCKVDETLNMYRPDDNLKAGAEFLNKECLTLAFSRWKVAPDDNLALLKKALTYYGGGGSRTIYETHSWQDIVAQDGHYGISVSYPSRYFTCPRSLAGTCDDGCDWWE